MMDDKLKEKLQNWRDAHSTWTKGYCDLDELLDLVRSCDSSIEWATKSIEENTPLVGKGIYTQDNIQQYQDEIAWALVLKKWLEEEIARFPPLPVLPPPEPLVKVSGVVEEVTFTKGMICFDAEVYSTVRDELERKRKRDNVGALVAMTVQTLAGSQPHAMFNSGELKKKKSLHVKGKVDGRRFSGWFGMTDIRIGDRVEMAVMPDGDIDLVYAIINRTRKTISMTPQCYAGKSSFPLRFIIPASFLFVLIPFFPFFFAGSFVGALFWYVAISLCFSFGVRHQTMVRRGVMFALYERIADVLEFPGGERFRLVTHSTKILREKRESGAFVPRVEEDIPTPQGRSDDSKYAEEFFYYY